MSDQQAANDVADAEMRRAGRLIQEGRLREAEEALSAVSARRPEDPEPHYALGVLYLNTRRMPEADERLRRAVELDPDFAEAHYNIGVIRGYDSDGTAAIAAFRRAIELEPELIDAHNNLGALLMSGGRFNEAIAAWRRAAEIAPDSEIGMIAEAKALEAEGRLHEAEAQLRAFIARTPWAHAGLGYRLLGAVLAQLGRFDEAVASYDEAIAIVPHDPYAYFGRVRAARLTEADRPLLDRMVGLLSGSPERFAMTLNFALGKAFDDIGDYACAMRHFDAANALRIKNGRLDRAGIAAWVNRVITRCGPDFFTGSQHPDVEGPAPILILGMPRSGSTLVEQILSSHPAIAAGGELTYWGEHGGAWDRAGPAGFDADRSALLAHEYTSILAAIGSGAPLVTDKNPWNFQWIGMVRQILPKARFIHTRRNAVDTCLSVYFTNFATMHGFMGDRSDLVAYYREYERLMEHWRRVLPPDRYTEVQYEALLADPEAETRRLIAFCGLQWDDACLRHEANTRPVSTSSAWQARQPLYRGSLQRWKKYEPWLGELRELLTEAERA